MKTHKIFFLASTIKFFIVKGLVRLYSLLQSHAPNTSNLGSGRDQYTNWFRAPRSWRSQRALAVSEWFIVI